MTRISQQEAAQELLARRAARRSLLAFAEYTHPSWETGEHHVLMCEMLERLERGDIERLAVFAPPRHGKSELVSRRFPAWCMGRHPEWHMVCAQATGQLAQDTGADVREIIKSPEFRRVFPGVSLREDAQAAGRWITASGGVYYAAGVDGAIVGRGANLLDIDDPHRGRQDADSQRMRDVAGNWYFGDAYPRLMSPGRQLLTLTRWHEDDLAGRILPPESEWEETEDPRVFKAGKWIVVRLRAIEHEGTDREVALWPGIDDKRFPLERLHEIKATMIGSGRGREWNSQYQQNPVAEEGGYIRRTWFDRRWTEQPAGHVYIASDFAVTDRKDARDPDYTEHGVFAYLASGEIAVIDWWSGQTTADVWVERLLDLVDRYQPLAWFGTKGQIRRAIEPTLTRRMQERDVYVRVEWLDDDTDKTVKGRPFQAMASVGKILFPAGVEWADRVINQCVAFPTARHDDAFDTVANMCRAIAEAHPAISPRADTVEYRRDPYDYEQPRSDWRVA